MTKKQRAQVVELLRCAADIDNVPGDRYGCIGLVCAGFLLDYVDFVNRSKRTYQIADEVFHLVMSKQMPGCDDAYHLALLEAARRVEEGGYL